METSSQRWQGGFKRHKSPHHMNRNRNNDFRQNKFYKSSRTPRYQINFNGYLGKKNFQQKRNNKPKNISPEDAEEEERKRKLTDTANKLLNKIKTWSAEKSEESPQEDTTTNTQPEQSSDAENKRKRIAHSKKTKQISKKKQPTKAKSLKTNTETTKYDVNKATVKDFQNRIQHKLINEIMQMPKENLQNVLNDPKINPIMEVKMSRLVKENKPLIARKLRALAEAKMTSTDSGSNSQLLVDIDKLIDPVVETDLSVLPYELIKQMENIFQVQFDYNQGEEMENVSESLLLETLPETCGGENIISLDERNEDLRMYECSTDEDEEMDAEVKLNILNCDAVPVKSTSDMLSQEETNIIEGCDVQHSQVESPVEESSKNISGKRTLEGCENGKSNVKKLKVSDESVAKATESTDKQDEPPPPAILPASVHQSTQTSFSNTTLLYGIPLPQVSLDNDPSSLLEEVNAIHKLVTKLNERKFRIFLDLLKSNSSNNFIDDFTCDNFVETFSGGNMYLADSLIEFFRNKHFI